MPLPAFLEQLARECRIIPYRSSGPGGQKKNKTESSVRVIHVASGLTRIATESRSQNRNRELALRRVWEELERRARKPKPRRPTRPTRASADRRLESKRRHAETKRGRAAPEAD